MSIKSRLGAAAKALFAPDKRFYSGAMHVAQSGLSAEFKPFESIDAYGDNPWLKSAVDVISSEVAQTNFHLQRERSNGDIEIIKNHQAIETLKYPQPNGLKTTLTGRQLFTHLTQHLLLNGEAFWHMDERIRLSGAPKRINPLLPGYVYEKVAKDGEIQAYEYKAPDYTKIIKPEDMVHFRFPNPGNMFRGFPPTKSIRYPLDIDREANVLNLKGITNGAVPSGILKTEQAVTEDERTRILAQFKKLYGGADNRNKVAFMPKGIDYDRIQDSLADMEYSQGKTITRDEILANFRVGMELLGKTEGQTRANAEASDYFFSRYVIKPLLELIIDTLNNDYLQSFAGVEGLQFAFKDPVPENVEEKRMTVTTLFDMGALTPNEARKEFGLEPLEIPEADLPHQNLNKLPVGAEVEEEPVAA